MDFHVTSLTAEIGPILENPTVQTCERFLGGRGAEANRLPGNGKKPREPRKKPHTVSAIEPQNVLKQPQRLPLV